MPAEWVVLLEAVKGEFSPEVNKGTLSRLLENVAGARLALHDADRYAVQFHVPAGSAPEALTAAVCSWTEALSTCGVAPWELVRAEVLTRSELEYELALAVAADGSRMPGPAELN